MPKFGKHIPNVPTDFFFKNKILKMSYRLGRLLHAEDQLSLFLDFGLKVQKLNTAQAQYQIATFYNVVSLFYH